MGQTDVGQMSYAGERLPVATKYREGFTGDHIAVVPMPDTDPTNPNPLYRALVMADFVPGRPRHTPLPQPGVSSNIRTFRQRDTILGLKGLPLGEILEKVEPMAASSGLPVLLQKRLPTSPEEWDTLSVYMHTTGWQPKMG